MATSTISLYNTPITPERNAWIENIESFINPLKSMTLYDMQYIKHGVNIHIKVSSPQPMLYQANINYAKIQNFDDIRPFYYFIMSFNWLSTNTIELTLALDTVNTFLKDKSSSEIFTPRTNIIREHLSRFHDFQRDGKYQRDIHKISEGINPVLYKVKDTELYDYIEDNFYLVYRTRDDLKPENIANPVECYLLADNPINLKGAGGTGNPYRIDSSSLPQGTYFYISFEDSPTLQIRAADGSPWRDDSRRVYRFFNDGTNIVLNSLKYKKENNYYVYESGGDPAIWTKKSNWFDISNVRILYKSLSLLNAYNDIINLPVRTHINAGLFTPISTIPFKELDRTDNRIVKIIKLPYAPSNLKYNAEGELEYDHNTWDFIEGMLKLRDLDTSFKNVIQAKFDTTPLASLYVSVLSNEYSAPSPSLESKLYHSDFFVNKLVYDTFSYTFKPENTKRAYPDNLPVSFKVTNTINSKMLFKVEDLNKGGDLSYTYYEESDYEGYINVARNNEVVIFNNDYVNYIKTGFNYDKKRIEQQESYSWSSTGIQIAGAVVSGVVGGLTGNPISAATAIALGTSAVASFASNINSQISNERNMEAKLAQLAHQRSNVFGSDDIDLLQEYNNNKARQIVYSVKDEMKNLLFNLFFYTGYSNPINDIPILDSRCWFNFIQCKPFYTKEILNEVPKNYLDDITARLNAGVTRFHQHKGEYNFNQDKENLETWLTIK